MSGIGYMVIGGIILFASTALFITAELVLQSKKNRIKETTYQVYEGM